MSACIEIERKFLIPRPPALEGVPSTQLRQGYIATGSTEVRLRDADGSYTLTCKRGDGLVRREEEIEIDAAQFNALWTLTEGQRIENTLPYSARRVIDRIGRLSRQLVSSHRC
ncbi:hypothetical protein [Lentimonas sp. CC4]|uniref:hypothetical protein n=1 Tax=Lentimonas sp. CC4 TaxID=2676099 RepID=UPI001FD2BC3C|nr:hypothetical protein [Lentimonas sp. CC4]